MLFHREPDYPLVNLGMFNLTKGLLTAAILLEHTLYENFAFPLAGAWAYALYTVHNALIPAFLIASGYGFRRAELRRGLKNQTDSLLLPVLACGALTALLAFVSRLCWRGSPLHAARVAAQYAGGVLLGLSYDLYVNGARVLYGMGTVWYLLALFWCWLLLELLAARVPAKWLPAAVAALVLAGWGAGEFAALPYCILPGLIGVGYYYLGWRLKVRKSLQGRPRAWQALAVALLALGSGLIGRFNLADCQWVWGLPDIIAAGAAGLALIWLGVRASAYAFPLKGALQWVGRNSLYIIVLHTVEDHGLPWYAAAEALQARGLSAGLTYWALIAAKAAVIAAGYRPLRLLLGRLQRRTRGGSAR